jgi:hypothetical protein
VKIIVLIPSFEKKYQQAGRMIFNPKKRLQYIEKAINKIEKIQFFLSKLYKPGAVKQKI